MNPDLTLVAQRIAARLRSVRDIRLEVEPDLVPPRWTLHAGSELLWVGVLAGPDDPVDRILAEVTEARGLGVLPEVVLQQDTAVALNGHQLRLAETQQVVTSRRRETGPEGEYTATQAEADILRVARVIALSKLGEQHDLIDADVQEARPAAALLLSKLHGWKLGAPATSPGHAYARAVFEGGIG